jgi:hypothetical protein
VKQLPRLSPLLRESFRSMWTDEQCAAWARKAKPAEVHAQAEDWLGVLAEALEAGGDDLPFTAQRLAWLAELTAELEHAVTGTPKAEVEAARRARSRALAEGKRLRARLHSRMLLLVGGDEERSAALSIAMASRGTTTAREVAAPLGALPGLLARWRKEARLRLLADELGLDDGALHRASALARALDEADQQAEALSPTREGPTQRVEGRLLRELHAVRGALAAARAEGLAVPALKVRPALRAVLVESLEPAEPNARIAFLG